nr:hypothetical protein [uncultured Undibacterium sp.]
MKKIIRHSLVILTAVTIMSTVSSAQASLLELKWNEQGEFRHQGQIKAGGILEVCGKLPNKLRIDWDFKSDQALESNIHFHLGKKVKLPVKLAAKSEWKDRFETKLAQDYCWMWSNRSDQVAEITLSLVKVK